MEDKRIIKTRRNIKSTMIRILQTKPFEKITVSELCREGQISRITFYTYYDDKYALIDEMVADYIREADADYHALQQQNNPTGDGPKGYQNLLDCILNLYARNLPFFSHTAPEENPYLFSVFFNHIFASVDDYLQRHPNPATPYPTREIASLLCNGLWGVITTCQSEGLPQTALRMRVHAVYRAILSSALFRP